MFRWDAHEVVSRFRKTNDEVVFHVVGSWIKTANRHQCVSSEDCAPPHHVVTQESVRADALRRSEVAIARANHRVTYPARFMLVAAMNPCRCGRASDPSFTCKRGPNVRCAAEYQMRLSGPLLDRIDLNIEVPAVTASDLILPPPAEGSKEVAARVVQGAGAGAEWFDQNLCALPSKSPARKAASAKIAKIPFALSSHIARVYKPRAEAEAA